MFAQLQQQFSRFWSQQSGMQRLVLVVLVGLGLVLIPLLMVWANTPTYSVAFSGLSESDAGSIVEQLAESGISYKLQSSGTILVPSDKVYDVRLMMAREGLLQGNTVGFELFSGNTFGMTEFSQRVNYQRAIEGELERTIGSLSPVKAVRVHIVLPEKTLLAKDQSQATASVTVMEKASGQLDAAQVRAITHLVASSVEGLQPDNVVVVDVNGNMLASGGMGGGSAQLAQTDTRRAAEFYAAYELQNKVQSILDKALGPNKSVVQANVSMDWTERETTTNSYEPEASAVRSAQNVTEVYTSTQGSLDGIPGAISNLPPAVDSTTSGGQGVVYTRTESTMNYEITQIQTHQMDAPGEIKRISLSVLVDVITDTAQLATLENVISAAAGIDETRGDVLAVETLAFDRSFYETQVVDLEASQQRDLYMEIAKIAIAVLALVGILWYIQRLLKNLRLVSSEAWTPVLRPVSDMALPSPGSRPQFTPPTDRSIPSMEQLTSQLAAQSETDARAQQIAAEKRRAKIEIPTVSPEYEQLSGAVTELVDSDPSSMAEAIQLWLTEDENRNG